MCCNQGYPPNSSTTIMSPGHRDRCVGPNTSSTTLHQDLLFSYPPEADQRQRMYTDFHFHLDLCRNVLFLSRPYDNLPTLASLRSDWSRWGSYQCRRWPLQFPLTVPFAYPFVPLFAARCRTWKFGSSTSHLPAAVSAERSDCSTL